MFVKMDTVTSLAYYGKKLAALSLRGFVFPPFLWMVVTFSRWQVAKGWQTDESTQKRSSSREVDAGQNFLCHLQCVRHRQDCSGRGSHVGTECELVHVLKRTMLRHSALFWAKSSMKLFKISERMGVGGLEGGAPPSLMRYHQDFEERECLESLAWRLTWWPFLACFKERHTSRPTGGGWPMVAEPGVCGYWQEWSLAETWMGDWKLLRIAMSPRGSCWKVNMLSIFIHQPTPVNPAPTPPKTN